jgi:tetraprenyl-beta-curcumene synthase
LSPGALGALLVAVNRGLLWGIPAVSRELAIWRARAHAIPDPALREDALSSLVHKRDHAEGAALFWMLARRRDLQLLRLLVAYQTIWDFLDDASERACTAISARQLHLSLTEALDPDAPISDYYRHHPCAHDGGYLRALVQACREGCRCLPSYGQVRAQMLDGVALCEVQSLNHDPDPERRDGALRAWAKRLPSAEPPLEWFELAAAASGFVPHVLLVLAAERSCSHREVTDTLAAYFPWFSLVLTLLDSYNDWCEDLASGAHSYLSHYDSPSAAVARLCQIVREASHRSRALPAGHRHSTLFACMVAMHLSRSSAWTPGMRPGTRAIASAGGPLTLALLPLARVWRAVYLGRVCTERR